MTGYYLSEKATAAVTTRTTWIPTFVGMTGYYLSLLQALPSATTPKTVIPTKVGIQVKPPKSIRGQAPVGIQVRNENSNARLKI